MPNIWDFQRELLGKSIAANQNHAKRFAVKSLSAIERNSGAYQGDAKVNGKPQPMLIVRMKPTECRITVFPDAQLFVGDYVDVFSDRWLVTEFFMDENTNRFAKALLCNHLFRFQNAGPDIIERWGVVLDSSYLNQNDRQLPLETGWYRAYLPLDSQTERIFIDKRFAFGKTFNQRQEEVLSVMKVVWLDSTTANLSEGDSLLKMRLEIDAFNTQADNLVEMVCDYITGGSGSDFGPNHNLSWRNQIK